MINRQGTHGAGTQTPMKAPAPATLDKQAGARASVKSQGKTDRAGAGGRQGAATWRGEEVSAAPSRNGQSAEQAADGAEGNEPVPAEATAHDPDPGTYTQKGPARRPPKNDPDAEENAEEKRLSAAEEHAEQSSRRPPYGKL